MELEQSIQKAAKQQGLTLKKDDPFFTGVLLNKILLDEYTKQLSQSVTESITNVAIKEDVTLVKLRNLIDEKQVNNRKEIERTLNQFADNLQGRLHSIANTTTSNSKPASWPAWLVSTFLVGLLVGLLAVKLL